MMGSTAPPSGVIMNLNPRGGNGVSFTPQGRQGYAQMGHNSGSMDNISLNSTLSSNLSIGSSMSTGKFVLFFYLSRKFRNQVYQYVLFPIYSSVPNRRVGQNERAGGKILKKH